VYAADVRSDQISNQLSSPLASYSKNPAFDYSARKILGYTSEARISLMAERKDQATAYINAARTELDKIHNTKNYLEMMGLPFGNVIYGDNGSYYIPIADDTYAVRNYEKGPFWSTNKTTAVRDVELVSIDISINPDKAQGYLQAAQNDINANNFKSADKDLGKLLNDSIHPTSTTEEPLARLLDNIYLTRVLIRQENYSGARYTLRNAKSALSDYEKNITAPEARSSIHALKEEIDGLDAEIRENKPTLLQSASKKTDLWWAKLKSWTRQKAS
jgi:hypothetical protein